MRARRHFYWSKSGRYLCVDYPERGGVSSLEMCISTLRNGEFKVKAFTPLSTRRPLMTIPVR